MSLSLHQKGRSVELLKANHATSEEASSKLPVALANFYQQKYPDVYMKRSQDVARAGGGGVLAIYVANRPIALKTNYDTK